MMNDQLDMRLDIRLCLPEEIEQCLQQANIDHRSDFGQDFSSNVPRWTWVTDEHGEFGGEGGGA